MCWRARNGGALDNGRSRPLPLAAQPRNEFMLPTRSIHPAFSFFVIGLGTATGATQDVRLARAAAVLCA